MQIIRAMYTWMKRYVERIPTTQLYEIARSLSEDMLSGIDF